MAAVIWAYAFWVAITVPVYGQFNMWPAVGSTQLASTMGFSVDCLNAMYAHFVGHVKCATHAFIGTPPSPVVRISFAWLAKWIFTTGYKTISLISVRRLVFNQAVNGWTMSTIPVTVKQLPLIARWCLSNQWPFGTRMVLVLRVLQICMRANPSIESD